MGHHGPAVYDDNGIAISKADIMDRSLLSYSEYDLDFATLNDGTFVVTWYDNTSDGSSYAVRAQRFDATFTAIGSAFTVNTTTLCAQYSPDVAAAGDGSFVIVWASQVDENSDGVGDYYDVYAQKYNSSGVKVGGEIIATTQTGHQYACVAGFGDSSFLLTWRDNAADDGSSYAVMGRFYNANSTVNNSINGSAAFVVNTTTSGYQIS
ncbi:MAG: hypothetical protein R3C56_21330 [Pirellulaceae bacterium]